MMGPQERSHAESGSPGFSSLTKWDSLFSSLRERREFAEHQECGPHITTVTIALGRAGC